MGTGASAVAYHCERMGIEIVEGPAKAARMDAEGPPYHAMAVSTRGVTITTTEDVIEKALIDYVHFRRSFPKPSN